MCVKKRYRKHRCSDAKNRSFMRGFILHHPLYSVQILGNLIHAFRCKLLSTVLGKKREDFPSAEIFGISPKSWLKRCTQLVKSQQTAFEMPLPIGKYFLLITCIREKKPHISIFHNTGQVFTWLHLPVYENGISTKV